MNTQLEISDVIIYPVKGNVKNGDSPNLKAVARVVFNDTFLIHGVRIFKGKFGPFVTFPENSKKDNVGFGILTSHLRAEIQYKVLEHFELEIN